MSLGTMHDLDLYPENGENKPEEPIGLWDGLLRVIFLLFLAWLIFG